MKAPKLRLKGFTEYWRSRPIHSILEQDAQAVEVNPDKKYAEIGIRSHGKGLFHKSPVLGEVIGNKRVYKVIPNRLTFNIVFAWEQAVAVTTDQESGYIASHRFPMYRVLGENDINFLLWYFKTVKGKRLLEMASPGGAGRNKTLGKDSFSKLKINIPSLLEQQKIADFLSAVDKKIELLTRKKELLEQYKKGVMQRLFSREIRFKDESGNNLSDKWVVYKGSQIIDKINSGKNKPSNQGDVKVYGSRGLLGYCNSPAYFGQHLLIARVGANAGSIMKVNGGFGVTDNTLVVSIKENMNFDFIYYLLLHYNLTKLVFGSGQPLVTSSQIKSIKVFVPTIYEQKKIAEFLSTLDKKIQLLNSQIEATALFKKGLLQQMFV